MLVSKRIFYIGFVMLGYSFIGLLQSLAGLVQISEFTSSIVRVRDCYGIAGG
jgi:hypothetical protein